MDRSVSVFVLGIQLNFMIIYCNYYYFDLITQVFSPLWLLYYPLLSPTQKNSLCFDFQHIFIDQCIFSFHIDFLG